MPPSPVVMCFDCWKLKQPMSPIVPTSAPLYSVQCACEQSSISGNLCRAATAAIASMSHGLPNRCTTMIALVRGVMRCSTDAGSML